MSDATSRVSRHTADADASKRQFADDVQYYLSLTPRQLPSRYLYDALGSALFDAICHLPWYRITRAERDLLARHGRAILGARRRVGSIIELGGGSGEKLLTLLLAGGSEHDHDGRPEGLPYAIHLVDVSASALALSARALSVLDGLRIVTHQASYENGLADAAAERDAADSALVLFLGSNIGNFDPPSAEGFLTTVRASVRSGDELLLGADLVKPPADLLLAYDDPLGVTAAFNRNLLVRINRDLGANFDLDAFSHRAVWNEEASRVEMHLVSTRRQQVEIAAASLDVTFEEGETIWTESSYKYRPAEILALLGRCGYRRVAQWIEPHAAFALTLAEAI